MARISSSLFLNSTTTTTSSSTTTNIRPDQVQEPPKRSTPTRRNKTQQQQCSNKNKKKQPQRGMGVAQLERLRLQESLKSITTQPPQLLQLQNQNQVLGFHHQYYHPQLYPARYGPAHFGMALNVHSGGGFVGSGWVSQGGAFGGFETSQELSSIPNATMQQHGNSTTVTNPASCEFCSKKNKFNGDHTIKSGHNNGMKDMYLENSFKNGDMGGFNANAARIGFYPNLDLSQGVEEMGVHKEGKSWSGNNGVMEYQFFPDKNGKSSSFKEMNISSLQASTSCFTTSSTHSGFTASNASNFVDLSLKLSTYY